MRSFASAVHCELRETVRIVRHYGPRIACIFRDDVPALIAAGLFAVGFPLGVAALFGMVPA